MKKIMKNDIKNILIIRRNNIGDMICAIPVFKTIRKEFPQAHITILADSTNAGIIEGASFIDRVIIYRKGAGIYKNKYIGHCSLFRQNKQKFDLAVALKIGFSSTLALITLLSRARIRAGCIPERWHIFQSCFNLPVKGYKKWKSIHHVDALFEFLAAIGINDPVRDISIEVTPLSSSKVNNFFQGNKVNSGNNVVIFNISNNKPENTWPLDRFREVADLLSKQYNTTNIITSTPSDKTKASNLTKEICGKALYFDTQRVMDFAAIVAKSSLLICGEGGAMHIGAGVHTPTISLWGKFRPDKWTPYGDRQFIIKKGKYVDTIFAEDVLEVVKKNNLLK